MSTEPLVVGLDVGGTQVRAALARGGRVLAGRAERWPAGLSAAGELDFVADVALGLVGEAGAGVAAAGVSLAALLDAEGRVVQWPNRPEWRGLAFREQLSARLAAPVVVEDDANAAALAEAAFGAGRGCRHLLVLMVGTGVGAGLVLDGRLFRGRRGWAGEIGHVTVLPGGPECPCGKRGCLQVLSAGRALERVAAEHGLTHPSQLAEAAAGGELWASEALSASGRWLGFALAGAVNLLDLELIVVGGGLSGLGDPWWGSMEEALRENTLNAEARQVRAVRAELPDTAGVLGGVALAREFVRGAAEKEEARRV
ncbi:MAG TPA: ROK family protein [Pyrinomonadaceae bacterium]|jgi:glucokinase